MNKINFLLLISFFSAILFVVLRLVIDIEDGSIAIAVLDILVALLLCFSIHRWGWREKGLRSLIKATSAILTLEVGNYIITTILINNGWRNLELYPLLFGVMTVLAGIILRFIKPQVIRTPKWKTYLGIITIYSIVWCSISNVIIMCQIERITSFIEIVYLLLITLSFNVVWFIAWYGMSLFCIKDKTVRLYILLLNLYLIFSIIIEIML